MYTGQMLWLRDFVRGWASLLIVKLEDVQAQVLDSEGLSQYLTVRADEVQVGSCAFLCILLNMGPNEEPMCLCRLCFLGKNQNINAFVGCLGLRKTNASISRPFSRCFIR